MLGYPEAAVADAKHALKDAREIGLAHTLMFALFWASLTVCIAETTRQQTRLAMNFSRLADEKGTPFFNAAGIVHQGCVSALTGKAADAVQNNYLWNPCMEGQWEQHCLCLLLIEFSAELTPNLANSMMLGAALVKR